jgi:DNA-binding PadR family transcriptional regulator
METSKRLTTTEYAVLGLLASGERSGYDLSRTAARSIGYMWSPSRSQIYKVLPRLVAWGLAESREVEQRGRPDKALYRVTDAGLEQLRTWVEEVEEDPAGGTGVFLLKLFFSDVAPEAGRGQLTAYRHLLERRLTEFEQIRGSLPEDEPVRSLIALEHGIARARATLAWADETEERLSARATNPARPAG